MIHNAIKNALCDGHWGVSSSLVLLEGQEPYVLVQLQNIPDEARVALSPGAAEAMAQQLLEHAALARAAKPIAAEARGLALDAALARAAKPLHWATTNR